jgi:asparagine synthase (glutamine-hydrolysing)
MSIYCRYNKGFQWYSSKNTFAKGYLYDEQNKLFADEQIIQYFDKATTVEIFQKKLRTANGFFLVIKKIEEGWVAAVDHIRSMPLFFSKKENEILISDDAFYLHAKFGKNEINSLQKSSFLLAGHTLENHTLVDEVLQLEAGQYLYFNGEKVMINDYYKHQRGNYSLKRDKDRIEELNQISINIFKRLIQKADGRQLVIPLSGGYDSRYIVAMLKQMGYEKVVTYTYGTPSSYEVKIAQKVAERLNYKWHFIEYPKDWTPYYECHDYQIFASQLASLPHEQDFLAVKDLKEKKLIDDDAILVPGFCGDLLGGSVVPDFYKEDLSVGEAKLKKHILETQFCYENKIDNKMQSILSNQIEKTIIDHSKITTINDFVNVNEWFFTKNFVSKYVVNGLRVYEYFGYEWSMPLWDKELIEWWYRQPNQDRVGEERLYNSFLLNHIFSKNNIAFPKYQKRGPNSTIKTFLGERIMTLARVAFINSPFYNDINSTIPLLKLFQIDLKKEKREALMTTKPNKIMAAWTMMFLEKII